MSDIPNQPPPEPRSTPSTGTPTTGTPTAGTPTTGTPTTGTPTGGGPSAAPPPAGTRAAGTRAAGTQTADPRATDPGTADPRAADTARQYVPRQTAGYDDAGATERFPSGAALGLTLAAAVIMMVSGVWDFLAGLIGIIKGSFFVVLPNYSFSLSAVAWGWLHLILGVVVFAAGAALLMDRLWARAVGVILASFSAIANFLFIPYYPIWSVVVIALDVFVIWALLSPRRRYA